MKNNKFEVLQEKSDGNFLIRFEEVYEGDENRFKGVDWVRWDEVYTLPKTISGSIDAAKSSKESIAGLSAGPLIVPFKFRLDDDALGFIPVSTQSAKFVVQLKS
ncbi:hypothetical protein [Marinobacter alexandrii]|uniref:hypothetical protein n=1 Tax=Marinobacter alexandrii TaxID=2570351 RepID=UPI00110914AA|nr:hypothetical protein [Marinobacter alexandrii]